MEPKALILSTDAEVMAVVSAANVKRGLDLEPWPYLASGFASLAQPGVRLVVIDDSGIRETERAWLVAQVHKLSPDARLIYLAENHTPENELRVRQSGVDYYVSRPFDGALLTRVVESFIRSIP